MTTSRIALAIIVGVLIALALPDYIGLGVGFWSFVGHSDLTSKEASQFLWLSLYCAGMVILLAGLAIIVLLQFTKMASKRPMLGPVVAGLALSLACLHIVAIYVGANWIQGEARGLFVDPSERHAWMVMAASLSAIIMFLLDRADLSGQAIRA